MWQRMKRRGGKQGLIVLFEENGERKKENPNYLFHRTHTKKEREKNAVRNNIESERETIQKGNLGKRGPKEEEYLKKVLWFIFYVIENKRILKKQKKNVQRRRENVERDENTEVSSSKRERSRERAF